MLLLTVMFRSVTIAVKEPLGKANWWLPAPLARILPKTSLGVHHYGRAYWCDR